MNIKLKKMLLIYSEHSNQQLLQIADEEILSKARTDEEEREKYEDEIIRKSILTLFIEERNSETKYETLQTESEVIAVKNTIEKTIWKFIKRRSCS